MNFTDTVRKILASANSPMTPQEIGEFIKRDHPEFYGTQAHIRNVNKGHYKDINHALLAQIYLTSKSARDFYCNRSSKPMKVSLRTKTYGDQIGIPGLVREPTTNTIYTRKKLTYPGKVQIILQNADTYHQAYYREENFGDPCLYFHQRALETRQSPSSVEHLECIYATLVAWGMHRLGRGGPKMKGFEVFSKSIIQLEEEIIKAQKYDYRDMNKEKWSGLEKIFMGIQIMASGTSLVGNSKVMHHMLPNIVPPIDRNYTLTFLHGNTNIFNDKTLEWQLMKEVITEFFIPVASDNEFQLRAGDWMRRNKEFPWDTSILKIVDNLIIGARK
jgi:hypothetical protein